MNILLEQLARICRDRPLEEKVLIVPTWTVGHELTGALARRGVPVVNLRVSTIDSLAFDIASEVLIRSGKRLVSRAHSIALVETACLDTIGDRSYFAAMRSSRGLHRAMRATLNDLRRSAVDLSESTDDCIESNEKARDIRAVGRRYVELLERHGFMDRADVLRIATAEVPTQSVTESPVFVATDLSDFSSAERAFLDRLCGHRLIEIEREETWDSKNMEIFAATGAENEIREIVRRAIRYEIPFDEIEIVVSSSDPYVSLIHEMTRESMTPATFQSGIPVLYTRPGRAAAEYLGWVSGEFDATVLRMLFSSLVVDLRKATGNRHAPGGIRAARLLRKGLIGWGRDRYHSRLEGVVHQIEFARHRAKEKGEQTDRYDESIPGARALVEAVDLLLEISPEVDREGNVAIADLAASTADFVEKFASIGDDLDGAAGAAIATVLREVAEIPVGDAKLEVAAARLRDTIAEMNVGASPSMPGHLHVSELDVGGVAGRRHTFVVGLSESKFPGSGAQDPILLDQERTALNDRLDLPAMRLQGDRPAKKVSTLRRLLANSEGRLTLSWPSVDLIERREEEPASIVLEVFRKLENDPDLDFRDLRNKLSAAPVAFQSDQGIASEGEWWIREVLADRFAAPDFNDLLHDRYPSLRDGAEALMNRRGPSFSRWDGLVGSDAGSGFDPREDGRTLSSSRLELAARCPYAFFLQTVVRIKPPEDLVRDPERWLDPMQFGELFHDVLREFMEEVVERGESPEVGLHRERLNEIAGKKLMAWRLDVPAPNESSFEERRAEMLAGCEVFLDEEQEYRGEATARAFEVPFGLPDENDSFLALDEPVEIDVGDGRSILLRGRVDRVDESEYGWIVWDYKSGSAWGYDDRGYVLGGEQLQHVLYSIAVEAMLTKAELDGSVITSGYYFPSRRGQGKRISFAPDPAAAIKAVGYLSEIVASGSFVHAFEAKACTYCDYQMICSGPVDAAARSLSKITHSPIGDDRGIDALRALKLMK